MISDLDHNFIDETSESSLNESNVNYSLKGISLAEKLAQEQAQKNLLARKRIDELKEKKRLKYLLDDSNDW
ncbi:MULTISPECIES: PA3496 family putative envelope integrity protein [Colwellia]|uniref:Uncharacterized protein n=1 Tax=Colwellia marinimaniae TaxID=1513592 RepID=A0ABQ0MZN5_9GAMM|nr:MULTISPECIES: hypothetical protein [Colwellia]GAW97838.1 hypothetical protein MTCD1_03486 [Colwellia marinimaniae]